MSVTKKSKSGTVRKTAGEREYNRIKRLENRCEVYPIFTSAIECASNDEYWRLKLLSASRGRLPPNFFMRNEWICFNNGKGDIIREELEGTPREICNKFRNFLQINGKMYSDIDIELIKNSPVENEKKKTQKGVVETDIYEYFVVVKDELGLEGPLYESYKNAVFSIIRLKGKKIIRYENGTIVKVRGIAYDDVKNRYYIKRKYLDSSEKKKNSKNYVITSSFYKSKEEDFEEILKISRKNRCEKNLNDVLDVRKPLS